LNQSEINDRVKSEVDAQEEEKGSVHALAGVMQVCRMKKG